MFGKMIFQSSYNKLDKLIFICGIVLSGFLTVSIVTFDYNTTLLVFLGLFISIFLLVVFFKKYDRGWLLFAALLPFWTLGEEGFRINIGRVYHLDFSMIVLFLLGITIFLLFFMGRFKNNNIPNLWLICVFFIYNVFSLLYGLYFYEESDWGLNWGIKLMATVSFGIYTYILIAITIKDSQLLEKMFKFIFIFTSILLIFLFYWYFFIFHSPFLGTDIFRYTAKGKSQLALFLTLFTPVMLTYTIFHKNWISFLGCLIFLFSLIYTVNRGVYLSIFVATVFLLIISKRKFYLKLLILAMVIIGIFLSIFVPQIISLIRERTVEEAKLGGWEEKSRMVLISGGLKIFLAHPIFGIGLGNFTKLEFPIPPYTDCLSHNDYIQILVEQGLIGFLIYLFLLGSMLKGLIKIIRENIDKIRWLQEGIAASLISMMVFSLTLNIYNTLPVWYFFGCSAVISNLLKKETRKKDGI
jgi:O-antigen ligase